MEKVKNIQMINYILKENSAMELDLMEKNMIKKII